MEISLVSFSYKTGLPDEFTSWSEKSHGGGFAFDCRCLPNPGREERFKKRTGLDFDVVEYLEANSEVSTFYSAASTLVVQAVSSYLERDFTYLMVSFGCTGGQHRSVYMVERTAKLLHEKFADRITVNVEHLELLRKGMLPKPAGSQ